MSITKWFDRPRTIGSHKTKDTRVSDEVYLLPPERRKGIDKALEMAIGKEWRRVPTRSMMELVSLRFSSKQRDFAGEEVSKVISSLVDLSDVMSAEQRRFLAKFDHLPKSVTGAGPWMDGAELIAYEKADSEAMHQCKTQYFVISRGVLQATDQSKGIDAGALKPQKSFTMNPVVIVFLLIAVAIVVVVFT